MGVDKRGCQPTSLRCFNGGTYEPDQNGVCASTGRRCSSRKTEGATPFGLYLHVGDVGHTLVVGPTGGNGLLRQAQLTIRRLFRK